MNEQIKELQNAAARAHARAGYHASCSSVRCLDIISAQFDAEHYAALARRLLVRMVGA